MSFFSFIAETTEDDEKRERINPKLSVEKTQPTDESFNASSFDNKQRKEYPHHQQQPGVAGVTPLYPPRHEFPFNHNRPRFPPGHPNFGPMRGPFYMQRGPFGPMPPNMRPGMPRQDMRPPFMDSRGRPPMPGHMYRGPMRPGVPFPQGGNHMPYPGPNPVPPVPQAPMPRKVLINPNFKGGGLEAATSKYIFILH